jgi:hypothetical protein
MTRPVWPVVVERQLQTFLFQMLVASRISVQYLQNPPIIYTHPVFFTVVLPLLLSLICSNVHIKIDRLFGIQYKYVTDRLKG